ncbi:MAG: potassium channel family protein [Planctomycetaceae bacterium]|nr:potassium channel family protein [Planctomycetaceae bacterium]
MQLYFDAMSREKHRSRPRFHVSPLILLSSLVVLLALEATLGGGAFVGLLLEGALTFVVLASALVIRAQARFLRILLALGVPTVIVGWMVRLGFAPMWLVDVRDGLFAGLLLVVVASMVGSLFRARRITEGTLIQAASMYLLLGIAFAAAYAIIARAIPGAFRAGAGVFQIPPVGRASLTEMLYFSFATFTTLGYGDITPAVPLTRAVAVIEATVGPLYLAIVIARLVAVFTVQRESEDRPGQNDKRDR